MSEDGWKDFANVKSFEHFTGVEEEEARTPLPLPRQTRNKEDWESSSSEEGENTNQQNEPQLSSFEELESSEQANKNNIEDSPLTEVEIRGASFKSQHSSSDDLLFEFISSPALPFKRNATTHEQDVGVVNDPPIEQKAIPILEDFDTIPLEQETVENSSNILPDFSKVQQQEDSTFESKITEIKDAEDNIIFESTDVVDIGRFEVKGDFVSSADTLNVVQMDTTANQVDFVFEDGKGPEHSTNKPEKEPPLLSTEDNFGFSNHTQKEERFGFDGNQFGSLDISLEQKKEDSNTEKDFGDFGDFDTTAKTQSNDDFHSFDSFKPNEASQGNDFVVESADFGGFEDSSNSQSGADWASFDDFQTSSTSNQFEFEDTKKPTKPVVVQPPPRKDFFDLTTQEREALISPLFTSIFGTFEGARNKGNEETLLDMVAKREIFLTLGTRRELRWPPIPLVKEKFESSLGISISTEPDELDVKFNF